MRTSTLTLLGVLLTGSLSAQEVLHESFTDRTNWSHTGGTWNDGINDNRSKFGKLDRLVSATTFTYTRAPVQLQPGTYVAVARFAKETNSTGAADIDLKTIIPIQKTLTTPVSAQAPDRFIHTRALLFTITSQQSIIFLVENADTSITKQNYLFDSFFIGEVPGGPAVHVENLGRRWGKSHGSPHYTNEVADSQAIFGHVQEMGPQSGAGLWWFDHRSQIIQFANPGVHTFNLRVMKTNSLAGAAAFDLYYDKSSDGGQTWNRSTITVWSTASQTPGRWVLSPNIPFTVDKPSDQFRFFWFKIGGAGNGPKFDYKFDSFMVRRGEFTSFGSSCMKGGDAYFDSTTIPQMGHSLDLRCRPLNTPCMLIVGLANPDISLAPFGWPNCSLYARTDIIIPMPWARGFPRLSLPIPVNNSLLKIPFFMQPYKATLSGGIVTANGARGMIEN